MAFRIDNPFESERRITQSVIQVTELLGMYQAELARILGGQCADIGRLVSGQQLILRNTEAWNRAKVFIEIYHALYNRFQGDSTAMYHWMRAYNHKLGGTPHFLVVDDLKFDEVLYCLNS
jgi:hypothetical protein